MATTAQGLSPLDPSSFSRPELVVVTNIELNLTVDFESKTLEGNVDLSVKKVDKTATELILDSSQLNISKIVNKDTGDSLAFEVGEELNKEYGSQVAVQLPAKGDNFNISIHYKTSNSANGLQWLSPNQTAGKKHPYLYSQFQPIHARSVLPCQDTPAVKTKYTAAITVPEAMTVLMSAIPEATQSKGGKKTYRFIQDVPIPSYLMAIAVGALESRKLGPRSHVWAEKEIIEDCAYEFADTERFLKTAEDICGPYVWGIYDLLVLPPSFPFGGMENPCLTFVTPTLLAGDRSLANVVAHEIAHSWTGNLVTNRNFEHFWLNEGFTVFVERKIIGRLSSRQDQDFAAFEGLGDLKEAVDRLGTDNPLTNLVVDLKGVHPDDAFSTVPYEKGYNFLHYLETTVGGSKKFESFLREYFKKFKYQSIDTDDFKKFFQEYFEDNSAISGIDWDKWLYSPGMPLVIPVYDLTKARICDGILELFDSWDGSGSIPINSTDLTTQQKIYLLQKLVAAPAQPVNKLKQLDAVFDFSNVKNAEIKFRWFRICLKAHWDIYIDKVLNWVNEVGRMKYVRPLYRDLYAWDVARERTVSNYETNKGYMMHVVSYTLAKDLNPNS